MSRNRDIKLKLYAENSHCYYCGNHMILTNIKSIPKGQSLPHNAATLEHLVSRYSIHRWKRKRRGERRKVLACYKCNHDRSTQETLCLPRSEILRRSAGFSLSPKGKPKIVQPLPTLREVRKVLEA